MMTATSPQVSLPPCAACGHYLLHPVHEQRDPAKSPAEVMTPLDLVTRYFCRNCGANRTDEWERTYGRT